MDRSTLPFIKILERVPLQDPVISFYSYWSCHPVKKGDSLGALLFCGNQPPLRVDFYWCRILRHPRFADGKYVFVLADDPLIGPDRRIYIGPEESMLPKEHGQLLPSGQIFPLLQWLSHMETTVVSLGELRRRGELVLNAF